MDRYTRIVADADAETRPKLVARRAALSEARRCIRWKLSELRRLDDRVAAIDAAIFDLDACDALTAFAAGLFRSEVTRVR